MSGCLTIRSICDSAPLSYWRSLSPGRRSLKGHLMDLFDDIASRIRHALDVLKTEGALPADLDVSGVEVETPRDASHGDFASNAAMVLAKKAGQKPRDLAEALKAKLEQEEAFAKIDVAGPGFLNIGVTPGFWHGLVHAILNEKESYGRSDIGKGAKANVEYVSANPTGPMHVGHCRGAVFGDALAQTFWRSWGMMSRASITSTMPARRWTCSRGPRTCAIARLLARTSVRFPKGSIPVSTLSRSAKRWRRHTRRTC